MEATERLPASADSGITNVRADRAMRENLRLLGGLAESSVHPLVSRSFHGYWVRLPEAEHQTGYRYPGYALDLAPFSDDFTLPGDPAPVIPSHDLFGMLGGLSGQPLCLPGELTETIDCYLLLDDRKREQVLRACYWVQRANRSFVESFSQSFLAVITVAETLMETGKDICETCGQKQHKLGTSFATFLDSYVPLDQLTMRLAGNPRSFRERLKTLYDSRSKITHGSGLPGRDGAGGYFSPGGNTEENDLRTLLRIMPLAAGTWIRRNANSL